MGRRVWFLRGMALVVVLVVAGAVVFQSNTEQQANPLFPSQPAVVPPVSPTPEPAAAPATDPTAPVVEFVQIPSPVPVLPDVPSPLPLPPTLPTQQPPLPTREVVQLPVPVEPVPQNSSIVMIEEARSENTVLASVAGQSQPIAAGIDPGQVAPPSPGKYCWSNPTRSTIYPPTPFFYRPFGMEFQGSLWSSTMDHSNPTYRKDGRVSALGETLSYPTHSRVSYPINGGTLDYFLSPSMEDYLGYDGHDGNDFRTGGLKTIEAQAAADGKVVRVRFGSTGLGNYVDIYHDQEGYLTRYAHLDSISVTEGVRVLAGNKIGIIGTTGNSSGIHLHFSVYRWNNTRQEWAITDPFGWDPWLSPGNQGGDPLVSCNGEISYVLWFGGWPQAKNGSSGISAIPGGQGIGGWVMDPDDAVPPDGSFNNPGSGAVVGRTVTLSGTASDSSGIASVNFTAQWPGQGWRVIYTDTTSPYEYTWDLCASGVPDGWIELGFDITDNAGNVRYSPNGTRLITKSGGCSTGADTTPPTASWTSPANGATISARTVGLQVNASDNSGGSGVREVRFSAKVNNTWVSAGNDSSSPYSVDWDLCAAGATDGSVIELGMEVWDNANNKWVYSEHFTNISIRFSYNCSQTPGGTEAILYDDPDYHGEERHFGTGKHDIGSLWNDRAHSLYLPGGWSVRLYADGNFQGQNACFNASTSSLPGPYAEGVSSLQVFNNSTCTDTSQPPIIDCGAVILHDGGGNQLVLTSSVNNLNELGWNDKARYIEIIGPYRAIAYDTENLQGWSHGPFSTGTYTGIGTNVSSVFVEKTGDCNLPPDAPVECTAANPGVYLVDSGGAELRLTASESNLNVRGWNDRPREMYVVGPYRATAYDNENLQGWSHGPLTHGQRQGIGTNVSSVRVELTIDCYNLPRAPEMPGSFAITGSANTSLTMGWANVANETGYRLYKWNGSAYALYQTLAADSTSYTDSGLVCGREYFYQIAAYNGVGESGKASVKGTTVNCPDVVDPVVNLVWPVRYTAFGSDQITLYAEASDDRAVSQLQFFVYYDDLSGASAAQIPAPPLPGETSAQAYNWHVIGYDTDGSDGWSITWDTASAPVDQVLAFWVYAYDTSYRYSSSSVGDIVLDRTLPTGALTMPIEGTYTSSAALWVRANASDSFSGMSSVRFYYWTGSEWGLLMTDSTAPYEYLWNISGFADGWQTVVAVAYDRAGNGSTIGWSSFAVDRAAPETAVDALPAYQVEPNFTVSWSGWDALLDSYWLTYDVQVQDNCAGAWLDWQINTPNLSADFSGTPGHSYCFRSRSRDVAGNVEAWPLAADASTAVLLPLAAPGTLLPDSQALIGRDDPIVFSWAPVADATGYAVEFWGGNGVALSSGWLTETEWTIPAQVGGVYQWRVRSHDDLRESSWSSAQALSVRYAPPTAVSVLGYNNYQVSLNWTASADAPDRIDEYVIDFLIDGNFSRRYWAAANATSLVASWLECETTYTVVIRAVNGALESVDSNSNTVTLSECLLLPPSPYDPPNGYSSSNKRPRFQWGASSYATAYEIQIGASDPPTTDPVQVNETHYLIPAPLLNVTYYWRVRALRNGRTSDWSPVNSFTVASDPNAPPELNVFSAATQVLSWERVSWAAYYEVEWSSTISFNFWDLHYKKVQVWQDVLAVMTDALPTGTYYWRVRAYTSAGVAGAWSAPQSFTLQLP